MKWAKRAGEQINGEIQAKKKHSHLPNFCIWSLSLASCFATLCWLRAWNRLCLNHLGLKRVLCIGSAVSPVAPFHMWYYYSQCVFIISSTARWWHIHTYHLVSRVTLISQKDCWHITNEKTTLFCEDNRLKGWSIGPKMCIVGAQLQSNLFPIRILNNAQEDKIVESICVL